MCYKQTLIILVLVAVCMCAETWYISPFGNNQNSGTSPSSAFFDLETALNVAVPGDTIRAAAGYYSGSVNVDLTLNGVYLVGTSGSSVTVFNGEASDREDYIFRLINGATVQGVTVSTATNGIVLESDTQLVDVAAVDMTSHGIDLAAGAENVILQQMTLNDCSKGIATSGTSSSDIQTLSLLSSSIENCPYGIYITGASDLKVFTVDNCEFSGALISSSKGIYHSSSSTAPVISVSNTIFEDYVASSGVNYIYGSSSTGGNVSFQNITATNNTCSSGCVLYVSGDWDINIQDSTFMGNSATSTGGVFYFSSYTNTANISNCEFSKNDAASSGGVIYTVADLTYIEESDFTGNAADEGGAIRCYDNSLSISNTFFENNLASTYGGALSVDGITTITSSTFDNNEATDGGAIYFHSSSSEPCSISYSTFSQNVASNNGGAIHQDSGTLQIESTKLDSNTASANGGGAYTDASLNFVGGIIEDNTADNGGGLYIDDYTASVNVKGVTFNDNIASTNGGGFACLNDAGVFLNFVNFKSNEASTDGSAYYCDGCTITSASVVVNPNNSVSCSA